jgi:hypothetical protein
MALPPPWLPTTVPPQASFRFTASLWPFGQLSTPSSVRRMAKEKHLKLHRGDPVVIAEDSSEMPIEASSVFVGAIPRRPSNATCCRLTPTRYHTSSAARNSSLREASAVSGWSQPPGASSKAEASGLSMLFFLASARYQPVDT